MHSGVLEFLQLVAFVFESGIGKVKRVHVLEAFTFAKSQPGDPEKESVTNTVALVLLHDQALFTVLSKGGAYKQEHSY